MDLGRVSKEEKKSRRDGSSGNEQSFIQWLLRQAKKIGDKLPHGDGIKNGIQIRLPYPNKQNCAMVFGCGVKAGVYTFWANEQVQHDSNLTIEVLRRTLLKLEECGPLPRRMYLQLDNASDNKSAQFLAFLAYLIEKGCFDCIKLSYLIVGQTHDIIDQWFSVLRKYRK